MSYLAGDIGGTSCRFLLVKIDSATNQEVVVAEKTYPSAKFSSLTVAIRNFLDEHRAAPPQAACLAVAGPVTNNEAVVTNLKWKLNGYKMAEELGIPDLRITNDFSAVGYGLLALERKDVLPLNDVPEQPKAVKACIGAGTGLGECFLTWAGDDYEVWPSEGGHVDFAPRDELEFELLQFIAKTANVPRVSVERVVSGLGIQNIYQFFCHKYPNEVNPEVTARMKKEDPNSVIAEFAKEGKCSLCVRTMEVFVSAYGAEAGNMALKTLPFGGFYIAGGIARKILWAMQRNNLFWRSFVEKGRMRDLLEKVPVYIVTHKNVGLLGAQVLCRRLLKRKGVAIALPPTEPLHPWFATPEAEATAELKSLPVEATYRAVYTAVELARNHRKQHASEREHKHHLEHTVLRSAFLGSFLATALTLGAAFLLKPLLARGSGR